MNNSYKVLVAMSGGVDSSVAAALLKEQGYQVTGVTMKIWGGEALPKEGLHHGCYGPEEAEDIEDARRVCQLLGIPFQVVDLKGEYKALVLDYFCAEYLSGRTPNPCVKCNHKIKFTALIEKARQSGIEFDLVASGHYARVQYDKIIKRYLLKRAIDLAKDQSYFLAFLAQEQLSRLRLPLGGLTKVEVRAIASRYGLRVADKPDSQNFISGDYSSMIKVEAKPGAIKDRSGAILGQHRGIQFYTIGQHKGLGLSTQEPLYVTKINPAMNTITVGNKKDIYGDELIASQLNWIAIPELDQSMAVKVKIRSSHKEARAVIIPIDKISVQVKFEEPQMAITPGQAAVFYIEDTVLGGGIIERSGQNILGDEE